VLFRGNTGHRLRKQNDGPYVLSLASQEIKRLSFESLSFRERDDYYLIEASNHYGRTEIKIQKDAKSDLEYEIRHVMYPMPAMDGGSSANLELFVSYQSGLKNLRKFKTDSNGLTMIDRVYGHEGKYNEIPFNIETNIYPVNRIITTKDESSLQELTVAVDRPQGATVLPSSEILIHLNRATFTDDEKGMGEVTYEN
jgi:hypothetical protein